MEKSFSQFLFEAEYDAVHSSYADIKRFLKSKIGSNSDFGWFGKGFYFTPMINIDSTMKKHGNADHFFGNVKKSGARNYLVILTMKKPFIVNNKSGKWTAKWNQLKSWEYKELPMQIRENEIETMLRKGMKYPNGDWQTKRLNQLSTQFTKALKSSGFDSVIVSWNGKPEEYVVFEPKQIRFKYSGKKS